MSIESQKAVIARLIGTPETYPEFTELRAEMFVDSPQPFRQLFTAVMDAIKGNVNPSPTYLARVTDVPEEYIAKFLRVVDSDPSIIYVEAIKTAYNQKVKEQFLDAIKKADDPIAFAKETLGEFEDRLERRLPITHISALVDEYLTQVEVRKESGVTDWILTTPWETINKPLAGEALRPDIPAIGGLYIGDYSIIGARPGMGKTSFLRQLRTHIMRVHNKTAITFLLEMTRNKLLERSIALELGVPYGRVRDGSIFKDEVLTLQFYQIAESLKGLRWHLYGSDVNYIEDIEEVIGGHIADDPDVAFVDIDHIGKLFSRRRTENRTQELTYVSNRLRAMSTSNWGGKVEKIHVCTVVQLNRNVEDRPDKHPRASDLKQTGGLEEDTDNIFLLYRDGYYNRDSPNPNVTEVIIPKNRNGDANFAVPLNWHGKTMSFTDMANDFTMPSKNSAETFNLW